MGTITVGLLEHDRYADRAGIGKRWVLRAMGEAHRPDAGYDLKVFFTAVRKEPVDVTMTDVLEFINTQRSPTRGGNVVRLADGEAGLSARTIRRRLATLSGLYGYLGARNLISVHPVPTGLSVRKPSDHRRRVRSTPLIRTPRTLPRILDFVTVRAAPRIHPTHPHPLVG